MRFFILLFSLLVSVLSLSGQNPYQDGLSLSSEFIEKLRANTPFTVEEGERFFGPVGIPTLNVFLLQELGYLDNYGQLIKPLPKYSPFGELLRLNRHLFIEEKINHTSFYASNKWFRMTADGSFVNDDKNTVFIFIEMRLRRNDIDNSDQKLISLDYNSEHKFFFFWDVTVNGKIVLPELGFYAMIDTYAKVHIKKDILENLKKHLRELDKR